MATVEEWYPMLEYGSEKSRLVVSDGGSKDNTLQILYKLQEKYPKLEVLPRPGTDNGTKVILLLKYAIENGAEWVFHVDSDRQTLPTEFPPFWENRKDYDAIMGNRVVRGDGLFRKFVSKVLCLYVWCYWGVLLEDTCAPFRLVRAETLKKYVYMLPDRFALPNAFLTACYCKFHERVQFREITFRPRQGGTNFINPRRIIQIGWDSFSSFALMRKRLKEYAKSNR